MRGGLNTHIPGVRLPFVGLPGVKFGQHIMDKVTQRKFNLGSYKYPGYVTLYRISQDNFNQDIIILGKDKVTQRKFNLGRYKYPL